MDSIGAAVTAMAKKSVFIRNMINSILEYVEVVAQMQHFTDTMKGRIDWRFEKRKSELFLVIRLSRGRVLTTSEFAKVEKFKRFQKILEKIRSLTRIFAGYPGCAA